jgi:hypothetical protein
MERSAALHQLGRDACFRFVLRHYHSLTNVQPRSIGFERNGDFATAIEGNASLFFVGRSRRLS